MARINKDKLYSVSELAREFALTPQGLRFYEDKGLLNPARSGRSRVYSYRDHARLALILKFRRLGFSLEDIAEYLQLYGVRGGTDQYQVGLEKVRRRLGEMVRMRSELDEVIQELEDLEKEALDRLAAAQRKGKPVPADKD